MKKEVKFFLIILALFILIFISGCRTQEELTGLGDTSSSDTTPTPGTEDGIVIQNNKVSTSCNSDDDCQLIKQYDRIEIELSEENPKNELWEIYRTVNEDGLERLPQMMNQAETELSKIAAEIGDDQFRENLDWLLNNNNRIDLYHITAVVNGKPYDRADDEMDINKARQFLAYRKIQAILLTAGETDHIDASRLLSDFIEKNHTVPYLCNTAVESLAKSNIPEAKKKLFEIVDDPKYGFEIRTRAVLAGLREEIQFESTKVIALLNEYVESLGEDLCQSIGTYNIICAD